MTIASEITRIQNNIAAAYTAASGKGATLPATENSDNLATCIGSIPSGGASTGLKVNVTFQNDASWDDVYIISIFPNNPPRFELNGENGAYFTYNFNRSYRKMILCTIKHLPEGATISPEMGNNITGWLWELNFVVSLED